MNLERLIIAVDNPNVQRHRDVIVLVCSRSFYSPLNINWSIVYGVGIVEDIHQFYLGNAYLGFKATAGQSQAIIALMLPHSVYIE